MTTLAYPDQPGPSRHVCCAYHAGPSKQATAAATLDTSLHEETPIHPPTHIVPQEWRLLFANPEILGEPPEIQFCNEDGDNPKVDPHYTGGCEQGNEDQACFDPEVIKNMEFEDWAIWLGKWFAHRYTAWVLEFDMKELENYDINVELALRDSVVGLLLMLCWTFRHFRLPEYEWRNTAFSSLV